MGFDLGVFGRFDLTECLGAATPLVLFVCLFTFAETKSGHANTKINDGYENRTRNLLIWSQTRYHCANPP